MSPKDLHTVPFLLFAVLGYKLACCAQVEPSATACLVIRGTVWAAHWNREGLRVLGSPKPGPTYLQVAEIEPIPLEQITGNVRTLILMGLDAYFAQRAVRMAQGQKELVA